MYHEALQRLIDRVSETDVFHRTGLVAIDTTEAGTRPELDEKLLYPNKSAVSEWRHWWVSRTIVETVLE
jgi:hypothetical protein